MIFRHCFPGARDGFLDAEELAHMSHMPLPPHKPAAEASRGILHMKLLSHAQVFPGCAGTMLPRGRGAWCRL